MCLHRITGYIQPSDAVMEAWKVLEWHEEFEGKMYSLVFPHGNVASRAVVTQGQWLASSHGPGFHAFPDARSAHEYRDLVYTSAYRHRLDPWFPLIRRVLLRGVHTFGVQNDMLAVIANEMFVPKEGQWHASE